MTNSTISEKETPSTRSEHSWNEAPIIKELAKREKDFRMLPGVAAQALELVKNPDCTVAAFTKVVERDLKLTADILGMANSCMYSNGKSTANLSQAVLRLGFRQCKNLIVSSSLAAMVKSISVQEESIRKFLWAHSVMTAAIAAHINRQFRLGFDGEEFTAGLVHDIGRLLMAVLDPLLFAQSDGLDFDEKEGFLERERAIAGATHCEVGGWFSRLNKLPESLFVTVCFHHQLADAGADQKQVALVAAADHMANHHQRGEPLEDYCPDSNPALACLESHGLPNATERIRDKQMEIYNGAIRDLAETLTF